MPSYEPREARRRGVRLMLRLGVLMLSRGAQAQEAEAALREAMHALDLRGGDAIVTSSSVTVSYVAPGDAETTTAIRAVRDLRSDFSQLAGASALLSAIADERTDIAAAEDELGRIEAMESPYPAWLRFAAPALLAGAVTILFGGSLLDAAATLAIGVAVQPALGRIERSALPLFFQVVFGVATTTLLVVALVSAGLAIDGNLVLTGGLLRFLPGAQLVAGMRDLIGRAIVPGTANLAEVVLLGVAIAGAASVVLALGQSLLGLDLRVSTAGRLDWLPTITLFAGMVAVTAYSIRLGVPRQALISVVLLAGVVVVIVEGMIPSTEAVNRDARTLIAALVVGAAGRFIAGRRAMPAAIWLVPTILPLLPSPTTLVPALAATEEVRQALQDQALRTAFLIGVGVASGDILESAIQLIRSRARGREFASHRQGLSSRRNE